LLDSLLQEKRMWGGQHFFSGHLMYQTSVPSPPLGNQDSGLKPEKKNLKAEKPSVPSPSLSNRESGLQAKAKENFEERLKKMEEHLQCSVCFLVPRDNKIQVCVNGHITCKSCKKNSRNMCPDCRVVDDGVERFSILAANISDLLELDCTHEAQGCKVKQLRPDIIRHEEICLYGENLDCPVPFCRVKVSYMNCIQHVISIHRSFKPSGGISFGKKRTEFVDRTSLTYTCKILNIVGTEDHLLLLFDGANVGDNVLITAKCLSKDSSKRYKLELELSDESSGRKKTNAGETLLMTESLDVGLESGNVLDIHSKTIEMYLRSNQMMLSFRLEEIIDNTNNKNLQQPQPSPPKLRSGGDQYQLYVGNLPHGCTEDQLFDLFGKFGKVSEIRIHKKQISDGRGPRLPPRRGGTGGSQARQIPNFCFVVFDKMISVEKALQSQSIMLYGTHRLNIGKKISSRKVPNEERSAQNNLRGGRGGRGGGGWRGAVRSRGRGRGIASGRGREN